MKKLMGLILVICGLFILFAMFTGSGIRSWFSQGQSNKQSVQMAEAQNIHIKGSSQDIRIIPEKRQNLSAVLHGKGAKRYDLDVDRQGDTIKVKLAHGWLNINVLGFLNHVTLEVHVPAGYKQNMDVNFSSGRFNFAGPSKDTPMSLDKFSLNMSSGIAHLKNLKINQFKQKASSGIVDASGIATREASFKVSSGSIALQHYTGPVNAKLSSGKFTAQIDELTGPVDVNESSGNISLTLPEEAGFTLDGKVSSGNISNQFPLKNQKVGRNHLEGTHGSGEHHLKLRASSGNIDIH